MHADSQSVVPTHHWPSARVLVAENDDELRWLITHTLRKRGFDVIEARDGSALLDRAGEMILREQTLGGVDLIISDARMPGWSGLDVLAGLQHSGVHVPMVLMTAPGDDETRDKAARLGAVAVVDKPVDMDHLCQVVLTSIQWKTRAPKSDNGAAARRLGRAGHPSRAPRTIKQRPAPVLSLGTATLRRDAAPSSPQTTR